MPLISEVQSEVGDIWRYISGYQRCVFGLEPGKDGEKSNSRQGLGRNNGIIRRIGRASDIRSISGRDSRGTSERLPLKQHS